MKKKAEREVVCTLCGKTFRTACPTAKRCPECRAFIDRGMRDPGQTGHRKRKKKHYVTPQEPLDEMAARAAALGMSYGQYSGIKRAGGHPSPRNREHYTNPAWEAWKSKIYGIVDRQRARVEAEREKGIK